MKYIILENIQDYDYGPQRWKVVESDLDYEQFKEKATKHALFGGKSETNKLDYKVTSLTIINALQINNIDLDTPRKACELMIKDKVKEEELQEKRKLLGRLKLELEDLHYELDKVKLSYKGVEVKGCLYEEVTVEKPKRTPNYCKYNDCGWCYYRGDCETTDINGACNKPQECRVNLEGL